MVSKPYVVSAFSLDTPTSKRAVRDKVELLLDEARYVYKVRSILPLSFQTKPPNPWPHRGRTWNKKRGYSSRQSFKRWSTKLGSEGKKTMA
jgi:hypothetical protein